MSSISFFTTAYENLQMEVPKEPLSALTKLFFNYAELTWSSSWTHGICVVLVQDEQKFSGLRKDGTLIQNIAQFANWVILGALLTTRMAYTLPILAVSLASKLYHFSTLKSLENAFPVPKPLEEFAHKSAGSNYQFSINTNRLNERMQKVHGDSAPKVQSSDVQKLIDQYHESANKLSKDGRKVGDLVLASFERGLPILRAKDILNQEFILSLKIALEGIINEKRPTRKAKLFDDLCAAFQGCQPDQQRFVASLAGQFRAVGGTIENFLFEKLKEYLSHSLELVIGEFHASEISSELMARPHLQMPHIISQYLDKFAKAGLYLPNYRVAAHDHILRGTYGGIPPYNPKGMERFHAIVHEGFVQFLDQTALEINEGSATVTKWLFDFAKREEGLTSFGFYNDKLNSRGWYQHMQSPTQGQEDLTCPYISRWEMVFLMENFGLIQTSNGPNGFKLTP